MTGQPADANRSPAPIGGGLVVRVVSSIVLVGLAGSAAWAGGLAAGLVVAVVVGLIQAEWTGITEGQILPGALLSAPLAAAMVVASLGYPLIAGVMCLVSAGAALVIGLNLWRASGVVYAAALGLSLLILRDSANGLAAIVFLFAVVWATDIGGFFAGRTLGGPKLCPALSPKKTWSGAVGGLILAVVAAISALVLFEVKVSLSLLVLAIGLSMMSQLGDLFESWVKRRFGVKDSGRIIPGHGGIMDRVDGLIFASVLALMIGALNQSAGKPGEGLLAW